MLLLSVLVMEEISRYVDYGWEWKTICKVINFKHSFDFDIFEIEKFYYENIRRFKDLKNLEAEDRLFKKLWLQGK